MRQTLFFIPHKLSGVSVFGFGWLFLAWMLLGAGWLAVAVWRGRTATIAGYLPFFAVVAAAIAGVFPWLEVKDAHGAVLGLPIRGYGAFVLAGFASGFAWSVHRGRRRGIDADTISSLAIWMFLAGFGGARLFFVIEYWEDFRRTTWSETLARIVQFTEGGLIVYGALAGALAAIALFCARRKLSPLLVGDTVAPAMALGLALGRIGCLMNGCCYGGVCDEGPFSIRFPRYNSVLQESISPPYLHQLVRGRLHGFRLGAVPDTGAPRVEAVDYDSAAARAGVAAGTQIVAINGQPTTTLEQAQSVLALSGPDLQLQLADGKHVSWSIADLPAWSRPVHPIQIYSTISALLVCLLVVAAEPYLPHPGSLLALALSVYPVLRIFEEMIRDDEPGLGGTTLTLSQWISLAMLAAAAGLWVWILRSSRRGGQSARKDGQSLSAA